MNQICKQDPVFQFVGEVIHEIIGTVPLGDPGGTLSLRRGLKIRGGQKIIHYSVG